MSGFWLTWFTLLPSSKCDPALTLDGPGILSDLARIDEEFRKALLPSFSRSVRRHARLSDFEGESEGWLPISEEVISGEMQLEVFRKKELTAGGLDGWGWRDLKALPLSWFDGLADILRLVEEDERWMRILR